MGSFSLVFITLLIISALITLGLGWYAMARREARGAKTLALQMAGTSWWTISYALLIAAASFPVVRQAIFFDPMFWFKVMFLGVVVIPATFMVFTLQFVDLSRWVNRYTLSLLAIEPLLVTVLVWSDPYHQLFFGGYVPGQPEGFVGGIAFWLHSLYSYLLSFGCYALLVWSFFNGSSLHRWQAATLILGTSAATVANLMTIFKVIPAANLDLTPFGFMLTGLAMVYNIRGRGFLDLIPVARNAVLEAMSDAVLVMDRQDRVLDSNPAALRLLHLGPALVPGTPLMQVFEPWRQLSREHPDVRLPFYAEVSLRKNETYLDAQVTPLFGKSAGFMGRILVLRDLSPLKRVEAQLRAQLAQNEQLTEELQELAIRDSLTGLYNRRFFEDALARELAQAERKNASLALCIIDIDLFKRINDNHGHSAGDQVIKGLADLLLATTRAGDMACRFGGEEFVLVLPDVSPGVAIERMEALRERFAGIAFSVNQTALKVTFSAGLACFPGDGADAQSLLIEADRALYDAKAAGRNRVRAVEGLHSKNCL